MKCFMQTCDIIYLSVARGVWNFVAPSVGENRDGLITQS